MTTKTIDNSPIESAALLTWHAHPARERPFVALIAVGVVVAVAIACGQLAGPWWGVGAVLVLVFSLHRFFFPSKFAIDSDAIEARYLLGTQRYTWSEIRRFRHDQHGAFLSTLSRASRLDAYRGMHLLFGKARDDVIARIRERLDGNGVTT